MGTVRLSRHIPIRLILAALVGAAAVPVGASAAPAGPCPTRVRTTADGWRRIAAPEPDSAYPFATVAFAVDPQRPSTIYTTNGLRVWRTTDGGCSWDQVYEVTQAGTLGLPISPVFGRIDEIVATRERIYLLVMDATGPRIVVSKDRGGSWEAAQLPAAPSGWIARSPRLVADVSGRHAYLLAYAVESVRIARHELLFATEDGGTTWEARPVDPARGDIAGSLRDVAVDPLSGSDVWVTMPGALLKSGDGGRTWQTALTTPRNDFESVTVTHRAGTTAQIVVASAFEPLLHLYTATQDWVTLNTPDPVTSAVGGRNGTQAAITTPNATYELAHESLTWVRVHQDDPPLSRLTTDYTTAPMIYACACDADGSIWSRVPRSHRPDDGPRLPRPTDFPGFYGCGDDAGRAPAPAAFPESRIDTSAAEVVLPPGTSKTVTYTLRVQPRELDVFFLVDTGQRSSMFACAAAQGGVWAAEQLARERNLRAGVGQYRDYQVERFGLGSFIVGPQCVTALKDEFVYRRDLRVGPVNTTFRSRMAKVRWDGTCSGDYAGLTGLMQAATGTGQDILPSGSSPWDIAPNQQAGYAEDAYKVVLHVAGADFMTRQSSEPTFDEVVKTLRANDIKQLGIGFAPRIKKKDHDGDPDEPSRDETATRALRQVAEATGALAPRKVTCSGRLKSRIGVGRPLVCAFTDDGYDRPPGTSPEVPPMGRQMVDLVSALADVKPMRVTMLPGSDADVATLSGQARRLDHLRPQTLRYTVTYKCGLDDEGQVKRVQLGGEVGGAIVATAGTTVRCGTPPVPPRRRPFEFLPPMGLVVPVAAPAAPQLPPQNLAPNTAPQPNGNPQNIVQGVGGMVPQTDEQPRLAYADANDRPQPTDELAMSALDRGDPYAVPAWAVTTAAGAMACAAGAFVARRTRASPARVRNQRT